MTAPARTLILAAAVLAGALFATVVPRAAHAQDQDQAAAEALFDAGRALVQKGEFEAGCQKLAQSYAIDPALGTLLNLADCQQRAGRTATAWLHYREAAALARSTGQIPREEMARRRAAELETQLCMLTIAPEVAPVRARTIPRDLVITRDGTPVRVEALGVPTPVDPGVHRIRIARGTREEERHLEARPAQEGCAPSMIELPEWALAPASAPPPAGPVAGPANTSPTAPPGAPPDAAAPVDEPRGGFGPHHAAAIATFGAGLVATGFGVGFGVDAIVTKNDAERFCRPAGCTDAGLTGLHDAGTSADVSTVLFAVGGSLLITGTILWLTSPSLSVEPAPRGALLRF